MIDKFYLLPYGCFNSLKSTESIDVLLITEDPVLYNQHIPINDELYNAVGEATELLRRSINYDVHGVLVYKGQVFSTTLPYEDTVNNKMLRTYCTSAGTLDLLDTYDRDEFFITEYINTPYVELVCRFVDDLIDAICKRTTYNRKPALLNSRTFREKVYNLSCAFRSNGFSNIHVVGMNKTDFFYDIVARVMEVVGRKKGKQIYSNWDMVQENYSLAQYVTRTNTDSEALCFFMTEFFMDIISNLHNYEKNGKRFEHIIKIDDSDTFYDTINKITIEGDTDEVNSSNQ